jgi:hypothetical protein
MRAAGECGVQRNAFLSLRGNTAEYFSELTYREMELIITPTQALVPLSILFIVYHTFRALFFGTPKSKHWEKLPVVGLRNGWLKWVWATLKSVRYTQDWAFEGYCKVGLPEAFRRKTAD